MLTLMLLRHAEAENASSGRIDADRPLTAHGKKQAKAMGTFMEMHGIVPELVLCSPARRTRQTWEAVLAGLSVEPAMELVEELYEFHNGLALMQFLKMKRIDNQKVMLVGHNPSLQELTVELIASGEPKQRDQILSKFPKGSIAIIRFGLESWKNLTPGIGALVAFHRPKDILRSE